MDTSSSKPTVAHFMPWSGIGGVEIATVRMTAATGGLFRNVALCLPDAHDLRALFESVGVETISYQPPEPSLRHGLRYYLQSAAVAAKLKACGADLLHFSDQKAAYHNSLAGWLAGRPMICHLRISYPILSWRDRLCLRPVDSFIFVSEEARQSFAIPLEAAKTRVIYDSVEVTERAAGATKAAIRRELGVSDAAPLIGMVARVSAQKDYFTLAKAAVEVLRRHPEARFLIVGDNSRVELNRRHYEAVAGRLEELGIANKFLFTGHRDNVREFIEAMDFCVLSTHREGFPLSILESMAMGKAVVATSVGGIPEIVKEGVTGHLHEHEDSEGLANAILKLVQDDAGRRQLGLNAREYVRRNFNQGKYVSEMATAYRAAMQS